MKRSDKIWMTLNGKPSGKICCYFTTIFVWMLCGIIWTLASVGVVVVAREGAPYTTLLFLAIAILYTGTLVYFDYKYKYVDAIYTNYLQRRQNRLDKITNNENMQIKKEV